MSYDGGHKKPRQTPNTMQTTFQVLFFIKPEKLSMLINTQMNGSNFIPFEPDLNDFMMFCGET
jgi:hypothetical protein